VEIAEPPFPLRSAWPLRSARSSSAYVRVELPLSGETHEPLFSAALGLAAALGVLWAWVVIKNAHHFEQNMASE
jgi:hypothetical protein